MKLFHLFALVALCPCAVCGPRSTAVFRASSDYHRRLFSDSRGSRPTNHSGRPMDCVLDLDSNREEDKSESRIWMIAGHRLATPSR